MTKEEKLAKVHERSMRELGKVQTALRDERLQCLQDRRFYSIAGAQWEGPLGIQFENKPKFEFNKIHLAIMNIITDYRNNRISVNFLPKNGDENQVLSDTCNGLYRADEQDSCAEEAYDNGFEEAVGGGFGAWRLRAKYEDEEDDENEYQRIYIEPIYDADSSVWFDLNAKRQDKSDAKKAWILIAIPRQTYIDEYGEDPSFMPKLIHQFEFDWLTPDVVYVAEYYEIEETKELIHIYTGLDGQEERYSDKELEENPDLEKILKATGFKKTREKKNKVKKCHKYIHNGIRIIEDCGIIAGKHIPIVPVYGKRWFIDNVERCMGHCRLPKDAQRLKNMQVSKLGEISALSTVEKPIFTPEEIAGHTMMWAEDNIKNYPYLLKNRATDQSGQPILSPIEYTRVPNVPPAMGALLQLTDLDMKELLGNQEAGEQITSNISGLAVELVQNKLDKKSFIYISNFAKAIRRSGEIWLEMAKELYVENGRKMKSISDQNKTSSVTLMKPIINEKTGALEYQNNLSDMKMDISVEIGPSSSSKRRATVRAVTGMMQLTQDSEVLTVLSSMAIMNMEGEGIQDVRDYFRNKLLNMGVVKPKTPQEMQQIEAQQQAMANKPPDPQAVFLQASAEEASARATKARADTVFAIAKADETKAKTAATMAGITNDKHEQIRKTVETLNDSLKPHKDD